MSGVEAAGLVLAVLPLLIEALSVYKKGLEKTGIIVGFKQKRYKAKVERLRLRLKGQSASLHLNLAKLLGRAAPSEDLRELPEDYNDVLWNGETREKIKAYLELGGTFEAFQDTLGLYEMCLQEIADNFDGILRPPKVSKIMTDPRRSVVEIFPGKQEGPQGFIGSQQDRWGPLPF